MSSSDERPPQPLFPTLSDAADAADDEQQTATEIESLCMNCHKNGMTRLLLTRIPHYKQVVVMSFSCEHCGFSNNELQPGAPVADKAVRYTLEVAESSDLDRQLVRSDHARLTVPHLELEIAATQRAEITTVEGVLSRALEGLSADQAQRERTNPEAAVRVQLVLDELRRLLDRSQPAPFTLELDDISGNSWIENPSAPAQDSRCRLGHYTRTLEQDHALGVYSQQELHNEPARAGVMRRAGGAAGEGASEGFYDQLVRDEVISFPTNCAECGTRADTRMKLTNVPHFKEVIIMATTCDACGHRTNEVKSGGGIEERGVRIELRIAGREDFSRDVLKSETCSMSIPELDLDVGPAALGGRFTTAEGLLRATVEQLGGAPELVGDAVAPGRTHRMAQFLERLERVLAGERAVTLVLDDPAGNSYVQSLSDDGLDPHLAITRYERSFEQNEELGLNDMRTEDYEDSEQPAPA